MSEAGDNTVVHVEEAPNRRLEVVADMKVAELKDELKQRRLKTSGNKKELQQRLRAAIRLEIEHGAESDSEEAEDTDDDSDDSEDRVRGVRDRMHALTFMDVQESMNTFSGDDKINIKNWIREFEETATTCKWVDMQKIIYAKRLLRGSAKLFINYEQCCQSWSKMKKALTREFSRVVDAHKIHRELARRNKRTNETHHEYIYEMFEIGKQIDMDTSSVIKYIIAGIQDDERNKAVLYGAKNIHELKDKFELYEAMKENLRHSNKRSDEKPRRIHHGGSTREVVRRCFLCGGKDHMSSSCPTKAQGMKCFKFREYGHIASQCSSGVKPAKNSYSASFSAQGKQCKEVQIADCKLVALIDTGSDLTLMRANQYFRIGAPRLSNKTLQFRGIGSESNSTLGEFYTNLTIDGETYPIKIHVVSDTITQHDLIVGTNFLNTIELNIKDGNISIRKLTSVVDNSSSIPEILKIDVEIDAKELSLPNIVNSEHKKEIERLVSEYKPVKTREVGIKMSLILQDDIPVYQRPRRLSPQDKAEVDKQIATWLKEEIIRPSISDYASPIVLVKKKDNSTRICVDYRQLNRKVIKDRYPLPLIEDQLDLLQGAKVFCTLDLKNGFFHVPIEDSSRKYTAFVVPNGHYEFLRVPFGLCNSPAVFQKFINAVFKDLIAAGRVLTYMDDLIIPAINVEQSLENLKSVLNVASQYGLRINWNKCCFLQTRVEYLGHIIENGNIQPSEHKTKAVIKFPNLQCVRDVQSFLGLTGYFRKFVHKYSIIARPLTNLLKKDVKFKFEAEQQDAFERLKLALSSKPVLRLYKTNAETELHTDASSLGYGAILLQRDSEDDRFHPIYFASGKTTPAEEKYCSYELEVLAIIKALRKFRVYLLGIPFKIVTDCQAFALTMKKKDLCVRVARWALLLEEFDYKVEHRPGKSMMHVDALSRNPLPATMLIEENEDGIIARLRRAQQEDEDLQNIRNCIDQFKTEGYVVKNNILYKEVDDTPLVVVPKTMQTQVARQAHERGHFGVNKTEAIIKRDYWFKGMRQRVEKVVQSCINCILVERKHGKQEGLLNTIDKGNLPLDTYHIDHLGPLPSTKKTYRHIFAVVDAFTKFVWLYATKSTSSAEVISRLKKQSVIFGNPRRIISDRGTAFTSSVFEDYCKDEGISHVLITTGIPRANGQVERINRTLIPLLTKLSAPKPGEWYKHLDLVQKYLNATPSRSTGTTPFHLLFGTHMKLREDKQIREMIENEWVTMFQEEREDVRAEAKRKIAEVQAQNRKIFNKRRKEATQYKEGDLVAIKKTQAGPGQKFHPKFLGPYQITKVLRNNRYVVRSNYGSATKTFYLKMMSVVMVMIVRTSEGRCCFSGRPSVVSGNAT